MAFGIGPFLAVAGSLAAQWILTSRMAALQYPYNFALLFLLASILMVSVAVFSLGFHVSMAAEVTTRETFQHYMGGGLRSFLSNRIMVALVVAYLLFSAGFFVLPNASLHAREILGVEPQQVSGWIDALRFGTKGLAGVLLGVLLTRFGARAPALVTSLALVGATFWIMIVPGPGYLLAFGLFGAGELGGQYYPHYVAAASRPDRVKCNSAIFGLVGLFGFVCAGIHGRVADLFGMTASMGVAMGATVLAVVIFATLPARAEPGA